VNHDPQFHASILDQVHSAVIGTDPEGRIVYWNRAAEAVYQWTAAEVMGRNIVEVTVPPDNLDIARQIMDGITARGHWEGEFRVRRKDGSTFPALVTDSVVRAPDGGVAGYVGITADLTAQKAAEERYRRVIDTAGEGICMVDPGGRAEFVNRRMAELLGYDFKTTRAVDARELIFDEDRATARVLFDRRRELELRLRRRDGAPLWTRISASPIRGEAGALWMVTDISERIAGEQKLRRLAEANIIGVLTADLEKVLDANAIFLDMVGYTREDLEDGLVRWPEMTPPEFAELDRRAVVELIELGACRPFEKELFRKDGSRVPVLIGGATLSDKPDWLCFVLDLTERNRAEEALRAVRHMESVGFLAAGVAHNLNNLLVGVIGSASLLVDSPLPPADSQLAQDIVTSGERAAELTRQLLAYSGKGGYMVQPVAVSSVIEGLMSVFRASVPKRIDVRYHLSPEAPPIEADETHIRQLVTDLVINASEAIDGGAGAIDISTRVDHVDGGRRTAAVGEFRPGRYIVIEVADTGAGMDDHTRARLFDPFFTTKFAGRGLGLAAVAGIVRSHHGAIDVATEPGRGSTFRVYLPV
jgi:two-component system, cell cycle sensor histidine kinase and response regulator CckA